MEASDFVLFCRRAAGEVALSDRVAPRGALGRSLAVGAAATVADLGSLALMVHALSWRPEVANVPSLVLGLAVQFVGNKVWAFRDGRRDLARQGAAFAAVEAVALTLNALAFHGLVVLAMVPALGARLVGSAAVYVGFSYPMWRRIFVPKRAGGAS